VITLYFVVKKLGLLLKSHGFHSKAKVVSRNLFQQYQQVKHEIVSQKKNLLENNFIALLGLTQECLMTRRLSAVTSTKGDCQVSFYKQ